MNSSDSPKRPSYLKSLGDDVTQFASLKADELKYKAARTVSTVLAQFLAYFLLIVVLAIVLGLAAYALLQWLNGMLGAPWGTLIVLGVFLTMLVVLFILRKRLFKHLFTGLFTDKSDTELDEAITTLELGSANAQKAISTDYHKFRKNCTPAKIVTNLMGGGSGYVGFASVLLGVLRLFRKKKKK